MKKGFVISLICINMPTWFYLYIKCICVIQRDYTIPYLIGSLKSFVLSRLDFSFIGHDLNLLQHTSSCIEK